MTKKKINESIAFLIEAELERAEVILAAKAITNDLADMALKVAKMGPEDVMPLRDALTTNFSVEQARTFCDAVSEALRGLTDKVQEVSDAVSNEIARLEGNASGEPLNDLTAAPEDDAVPAENDAAAAPEGGEGEDIDMSWMDGDEGAADPAAGMEDAMDELPDEIGNTQHAAGRARKESAQPKKKMLEADRALAREFNTMLKEGISTSKAAKMITETYLISVEDLIGILSSVKK